MKLPSRQPPARVIADRLHSAAIHVLRRLRVEDKAIGLSGPRASALSVIVFRGPIAMGALAEAEQVRPPTITRLVASLERVGLVRRGRGRPGGPGGVGGGAGGGERPLGEGRARPRGGGARGGAGVVWGGPRAVGGA